MIKRIKKLFYRGFKRDRFRVVHRQDGAFLVNYVNHIDRKIIIDGSYEREQLDRFSSLAEAFGAEQFFDIGANIGLYTIKMAKLQAIKQVHAFEPMLANKNQLHANVLLNQLNGKVDVHGYALSNENGTTAFLQNVGNSTGRSRIKATNANRLDDQKFIEVKVETRQLDALFPLSDKKLAIKIDVEGHEMMVLQGMTQLLANNKCLIQIESYPQTTEDMDALFRNCGYTAISNIGNDYYYANINIDTASS